MSQRLPPLKAIEAFVAVARKLSLNKAGRELNITKSAVSRRIQALERDLGAPLFRRGGKSLELTADGHAYLRLTGPAFDALHQAASMLSTARRGKCLHVALPQSYASGWLMPRLSTFYGLHPDIELHLDSIGYFDGLEATEADVAIRVARSPPASLHSDKLMNLVQLPVCSPSILRKAPLRSIADLAVHTRLTLTSMPEAWPQWLQLVGHPGLLACRRTQEFDTMPILMQAARDGLGVAMGIEALCRSDFEERRLVAPFRERLEGVLSLFFCSRKQDVSRRPVRLFREWLIAESMT
jgi:LysR family glycine cleavage system transcriptional activator